MSLALGSARLNLNATGAPTPPAQQVKPARTSIAEDAIFIPKPHKRVDFKMNFSGESLGSHGITAEIGKDDYGSPEPLVRTEYDNVPQKDYTAIATQEEGRQTNHAKQTHYTQQYDSYGRPRIGFSREPYDFAATKYVSKTSQIKFQQNMASTRKEYSKYTDNVAVPQSQAPDAPGQPIAGTADPGQPLVQRGMIDPEAVKGTTGLIDPQETVQISVEANKARDGGVVDSDPNGAGISGEVAKAEKGMVDAGQSGNADRGGAMMGLDVSAVLNAQPEKVADIHATDQLLKFSTAVSVSA